MLSGTAAAGSSGNTLSDAGMDFVTLGVRQGDVLVNATDGSRGVVDTPANGTLTLTSLRYGSSNAFAAGDDYRIGRYNAVVGVAQGQLPFHETDDPYKSQFSIEWNLQQANGITVTKPSGIGRYNDAAKRFVETSALSGVLDVALPDGLCQWNGVDSVDCDGRLSVPYFRGVATGGAGDKLDDTTRNFKDWGVDKGAVVENLSDPGSAAIVKRLAEQDTRLEFANDLAGGAVNAVQVGDSYRVRVPTQRTPKYPASNGSNGDNLVDTNRDFVALGVQVGDTVSNLDDNEWGRVTAVGATTLTVPGLAIDPGEEYRVYYAFVDQREYRFSLRLTGKALAFYASAGDKRRAVCANDVKACTLTGTAKTGSSNLTLADAVDFSLVDTGDLIEIRSAIDGSVSRGLVKDVLGSSLTADYLSGGVNQINPNDSYLIYLGESLDDEQSPPDGVNDEQVTVTLLDRDTAGNRVGTAVATSVQAVGTASGAIFVANLHVDLDVQESANDSVYDLPMWFTENNWHHLVYVAESNEVVPGADGVCDQGSDCLVLAGTVPVDNKRAVVVMAGEMLAGQDRVAGSACGSQEPAFLCDYFENENADFDLDVSDPPPATFEVGPVTAAFNDKVRVVAVQMP